MILVEHAPVDDVLLRDADEHVVEVDELAGLLLLDRLHVLAEAGLGERPVGDSELILVAGGLILGLPPVPVRIRVALEVEALLGGFARARIVDPFRHAAAVAGELGLVGGHVVADAVLGLAGGVALDEAGAAIIDGVQHGLVELGGVGHRSLDNEGRTVAAGKGLGDVLLLDQLALRLQAELVHVVAAQHGGGIGVLSAGVGVDLRVEHEHLHVGAVLQDDLGDILETDVAEGAVAADHPDLGQFANFLVGHAGVVEAGEREVFGVGHDVGIASQQVVAESLRRDRAAGMIDDEGFAQQPADGGAVLEQGIHPGIGVRVGRRRGAIDGVAARAGAHEHHGHAVGVTSVDGLQVLVIVGVLAQDRDETVHDLLIGDLAIVGETLVGVGVGLAAEAHDHVGDRALVEFVLGLVASLQGGEAFEPLLLHLICLGAKAVGLVMIERAHVGLGDRGDRAQDALFAATGAGAVAGDQGLVIAAHHEVVAQRGLAGIHGRLVVVEAEVFLGRVGEQAAEDLRGGKLGIQLLGLGGHPQGVVVAADLHALAAAFAEVGDVDLEEAALAGVLLLQTAEDRGHAGVSKRQLVDDAGEFGLGLVAQAAVQRFNLFADDVLEGRLAL